MQRPDVEGYEALASRATIGPWGYDGMHDEITADNPDAPDYWLVVSTCRTTPNEALTDRFGHQYSPDFALMAASRTAIPELCTWVKYLERKMEYHFDQSLAISGETQKEIDALQAILRDWLAACPGTCGQCDEVMRRAEEATK